MEGVSDWIQRLVLRMRGEAMYPGSLGLLRRCCGKWRWPPAPWPRRITAYHIRQHPADSQRRWPPPLFFTNRWHLPPAPLIAYPQQSTTSRSTA